MKIAFNVYGIPIAQGRPRFARAGKFVRTYDPAKSRGWKETVRWQAIENKVSMLKGALLCKMIFWLPRPKSLPKKVRYPVKKPDIDNLYKGTIDALEGLCFENDSQIIQIEILKVYQEPGRKVGVEIKLMELDQ